MLVADRAQVHITLPAGQVGDVGGPDCVEVALIEHLPARAGGNDAAGSTIVVP